MACGRSMLWAEPGRGHRRADRRGGKKAKALIGVPTPRARGIGSRTTTQPAPPFALLTFLMSVEQISPFPRASKWGRGLTAPPTPDDLRTTYRPNGHPTKYNKEGKTAAAYCMRQAYGTIGKSASLTILTFEEYSHVSQGRTTADTDAFRWHRPYDDCRKRNRNYAIC